ncbi:hypothetical protein ABZ671_07660 [Micromonospora sp. NPDC006766]|uniref:hypothetical protein n=1 Tax=Micromonospora sp. NPDC006766 TaxID=3154778 RepID=UPI0033EBFBD6
MTCRSPVPRGPPSTAASGGTGYGPGSLSSAYPKVTGTRRCPAGTTVIGMPIGAPSHVPEPKSAWTVAVAPIAPTIAADLACAGSRDTSACQTLSAGNTVHARTVGLGRAPSPARAVGIGDGVADPAGTAATDVAGAKVAGGDPATDVSGREQPAASSARVAAIAAARADTVRRRPGPAAGGGGEPGR